MVNDVCNGLQTFLYLRNPKIDTNKMNDELSDGRFS